MLYTERPLTDVINILQYIDKFTLSIGFEDIQINSSQVVEVCVKMRQKFPHLDGLEQSSTFKKVANFVAWFIALSPVKSEFPANSITGLAGKYNPNAVIAFDIAITCLENSTIHSITGDRIVSNPLYVSDHSYADIICALSQADLKPDTHYHLLAVFFEQLTYKSNPQCEYGRLNSSQNHYYPTAALHMDDMNGV